MNKRIISIAVVVFVLVLIGLFGLFLLPKHSTAPGTPSGNPFDGWLSGNQNPSTTVVPGTQATITDQTGQPVQVADFLQGRTPEAGADGTPNYDLTSTGTVYGNEGNNFQIQYAQKDSVFTVLLLTEPLSKARTDAEAFLRTKLGLSDTQLCSLNILVGVMASTNSAYANYENLGLSFCPNAIKLP